MKNSIAIAAGFASTALAAGAPLISSSSTATLIPPTTAPLPSPSTGATLIPPTTRPFTPSTTATLINPTTRPLNPTPGMFTGQSCIGNQVNCQAAYPGNPQCQADFSSCIARGTATPSGITTTGVPPFGSNNGTGAGPTTQTITYFDTQCGCTKTSTSVSPPGQVTPAPPTLTTTVINGVSCTIESAPGGGVVVNSVTVTPGAPPTTIGGQTVSCATPAPGAPPAVQIGSVSVPVPTSGYSSTGGAPSYGGASSGNGTMNGRPLYTGAAAANTVAGGVVVGAAAFFAALLL